MSLITLTFGAGNPATPCFETEVVSPQDSIRIYPWEKNKLCVKKVSCFYNEPEVYIMGEIVSGAISEGMSGEVNGKHFTVKELNCKYRNSTVAKRGMTIGISVEGISREEIEKDSIISFSK